MTLNNWVGLLHFPKLSVNPGYYGGNRKLKSLHTIYKVLRPNFATFLKKLFEATGGEFRIVNRYEVGEKLGLDTSATDNTVKQLCEIGMIKTMLGPKIILTQEALSVIDRSESSG